MVTAAPTAPAPVRLPPNYHPETETRWPVNVPTAAKMLGVSTRLIYELAMSREIPSIRVGRTVRIPRWVIDRYKAGLEPWPDGLRAVE